MPWPVLLSRRRARGESKQKFRKNFSCEKEVSIGNVGNVMIMVEETVWKPALPDWEAKLLIYNDGCWFSAA